ncbi:MAG: N-acetylneuraminic acid mutarotase [Candidatus Paceibacteria bacterium]|jgi:N-acetylneuraminic acid mutarotase
MRLSVLDRPFFATGAAAFITLATLGAPAQAQSWWTHDPMPTPRHRLAASPAKYNTSNYAIFAFGGTNGGATTYDSVEMFNPMTDTWTVRGPMPATRSGMASATADGSGGERVYLFGGSNVTSGTTTVWEYNAVTDTWDTGLPALPVELTYLSATTGIDGKIYIFGGYDDTAPYYSNKVFCFDPMTEVWSGSIPVMPRRRAKHASVAGCDGLIYVMGGGDANGGHLEMDVYDPITNTWLALNPITSTAWANITTVRDMGVSAATGRDGLLYMVGGEGYPIETGVMDSYNTVLNTWTAESSEPTARNSQALVAVSNAVYAVGGWKKYGGVQTSTESFGGLPSQPSCSGIVHVNAPGYIYCQAAPNSISQGGAVISGEGTTSVTIAELALTATGVPPTPGIFFYGPNEIETPFGDGFRCVGGAVQRLAVSVGQGGLLRTTLNFDGEGGVPSDFQPGAVFSFQAWYRDTQAGQSGFNLSNGYTIHFMP